MSVTGAPTDKLARHLGKAVVNSPLFKAAVAGNDPNVGRLLAVVGRVMGRESPKTDVSQTRCVGVVFVCLSAGEVFRGGLIGRGLDGGGGSAAGVSVCGGRGALRACVWRSRKSVAEATSG